MAETFLYRFAAPPCDEPAAATGPRGPRRRGGPVLMADILLAPMGRPLLLDHWRRTGEEPDDPS